MITERERLKLYERLGETIGREEAAFLMELLPPTSWDDIATTRQVQNLGTDLRGEMTELRTDLRGEMTELSSGMDRLQSDLEGRMAMLGGEMAKEMAKNLQIQVGANFAAMVTLVAVIVGLG